MKRVLLKKAQLVFGKLNGQSLQFNPFYKLPMHIIAGLRNKVEMEKFTRFLHPQLLIPKYMNGIELFENETLSILCSTIAMITWSVDY